VSNLNILANWAQIIALAVGVAAILVSIWVYRRSKQRRGLACEFADIVSPIEIKAGRALEGDIEILYSGRGVQNLFIVRAKLKNIGNLAIRKSDVFEPVTFAFQPDAQLLRQPRVIEAPDNFKLDWNMPEAGTPHQRNIISLQFNLFNPGEELTLEFLCTGRGQLPMITARIEGVRRIRLLDSVERHLRERALLGMVVVALPLFIGAMGFLIYLVRDHIPSWVKNPKALTLISGLFIIAVGVQSLWQVVGSPIIKYIRYRMREKRK
jgi:hypothetical protein